MASEYDPRLLTDKDWVRFLTGDRTAPWALTDPEITAVLAEEANKYLAAARCGEVILSKGRGAVSKSVGNLSISYGDSPEGAYRSHLTRLRERGAELLLKEDGGGAVFRSWTDGL